jgi:hypothetical protein
MLMARLLPLLLFLLFAVFLFAAAQRRGDAHRDGRTYRPRKRRRESSDRSRGAEDLYELKAADLAGIRDAYSGAELDPARPLVRCTRCLACFHAASAEVLLRENGGRCPACGAADFRAVTVRPS